MTTNLSLYLHKFRLNFYDDMANLKIMKKKDKTVWIFKLNLSPGFQSNLSKCKDKWLIFDEIMNHSNKEQPVAKTNASNNICRIHDRVGGHSAMMRSRWEAAWTFFFILLLLFFSFLVLLLSTFSFDNSFQAKLYFFIIIISFL